MPLDLAIITGSYKDIVGFFIRDEFHQKFLQSAPYTPDREEVRQQEIVADLGKTQHLIGDGSELATLTAIWRCYRPEAEDTYVPGLIGARIFAESADKFRPVWTGFLPEIDGAKQKIFQSKSVAYLPTIGTDGETIKEADMKPAGCSLLHVPGVANVWMLFHMADSTGPRDQIQMTVVMPAMLFPEGAVDMTGLNLTYHRGSIPFNWDDILKHPDVSQVFSLLLEKGDCCEARLPLLFPDEQTEIYKNDQAFRHPCKLQGVDGSYYYHFATLIGFLRAVSVPRSQDVIPLSPRFGIYVDDFLKSFARWQARIIGDNHRKSLEKLGMLCTQLCNGSLTKADINRVFMLLAVGYSDWSNIILLMIDKLSIPLLSGKALKAKTDLHLLDLDDVDVSIKVPLVKLQLDLHNLLKQLRLMLPWVLTRDEPDGEYVNLRQDEEGGVHAEIKTSFSVESRSTTSLSSVLSDTACDQACVILRGSAEFAKSLKKLNGYITLFRDDPYVTTVVAAFSRYCNAILQGDQAAVYNALNILVTQYPNWLNIIDNMYCPEEIWSPVKKLLGHLKQALPSYVEREEDGLIKLMRSSPADSQLNQEVIIIEGSLERIVRLLIKKEYQGVLLACDKERTEEKDGAYKALIKRDLARQACLVGSQEELAYLQDIWNRCEPLGGYDYAQGDMDGALDPSFWDPSWTAFLPDGDKDGDSSYRTHELGKNIVEGRFAYLTEQKKAAGFSLYCSRSRPALYMLVHIDNPDQPTNPAFSLHRRVTLVLPTVCLPKEIDDNRGLLETQFGLKFSVHESIEVAPLQAVIQDQKVLDVVSSLLNQGVCQVSRLSLISAKDQRVFSEHTDPVFTHKGQSNLGGLGDRYWDFPTLIRFLETIPREGDILRHTVRACDDVRSSTELKNIFGKFNALYVYDSSLAKEAFFSENKVMLDRLFLSVAVLCDPESTGNQINRAMITLGSQYSHWLNMEWITPEDLELSPVLLQLKSTVADLLARLKNVLPWVIEISPDRLDTIFVSRFKLKPAFSLPDIARAQASVALRSSQEFYENLQSLDASIADLGLDPQHLVLLKGFMSYCKIIQEDKQKVIENAFYMLIMQYPNWHAMMLDESYPEVVRHNINALLNCLTQSLPSYVERQEGDRVKLVFKESISVGQGVRLHNLPQQPSLPARDQALAVTGATLSVVL